MLQMVVEKLLAQEGVSRRDLGREEFEKRVWEWKEQYGGFITQQMCSLGASCDWSRERFTLDQGLSGEALRISSFIDLRALLPEPNNKRCPHPAACLTPPIIYDSNMITGPICGSGPSDNVRTKLSCGVKEFEADPP